MIPIGIDPTILQIGRLSLRWDSFTIGIGAVALTAITYREVCRKRLDGEFVISAILWIVIGALAGTRALQVLENLNYYLAHPLQLIAPQLQGLASFGATCGALAAAIVYAKIKNFPIFKFLDAGAVGMPLALAIGRIGSIINGDSFGPPTNLPWGIVYSHPSSLAPLGVSLHPIPIYEMIWSLMVFAVLWRLRGRIAPDGVMFFLSLGLYSFGRFLISFLQIRNDLLLGLREDQVMSLIGMTVAIIPLVYIMKPNLRASQADSPGNA